MKKMLRILSMACILGLCVPCASVMAEIPEAYTHSSLRRMVYMPNGAGPFQYYAQNDPIWQRTLYEANGSGSLRIFGDGGCNPTSLAIVISSLVPTKHLQLLSLQAKEGHPYALCSCSVSGTNCVVHSADPAAALSMLVTGQDFHAVLPLAFADYALGNNQDNRQYRVRSSSEGGNGGTSSAMFQPIADVFGLSYRSTRNLNELFESLDRGGMAIALCNGNSQIFSGANGHYIVVCSYDDEYVYILDPFIRDEYKKDRFKVIEPVEPGVKKIRRSNLSRTGISSYSLFEAAPVAFYANLDAAPGDTAQDAAADGPHNPS